MQQLNLYQTLTLTGAAVLSSASPSLLDLDATTAGWDQPLPLTTTPGLVFTFKKIDASTNAVRLLGTFDGVANYSLSARWKYVTVKSTATAGVWEIIGNN